MLFQSVTSMSKQSIAYLTRSPVMSEDAKNTEWCQPGCGREVRPIAQPRPNYVCWCVCVVLLAPCCLFGAAMFRFGGAAVLIAFPSVLSLGIASSPFFPSFLPSVGANT